MEKHILQEKIEAGLTLKQISKDLQKSQTNIRVWIKKFGLKLLRGSRGKFPKDFKSPRKCNCGETDPANFYGHKVSICGKCQNKYNHEQGRIKRRYILNKLGGKCSVCDFDRYKSALDVHHLDPTIKDAGFNTHRYWSYAKIDKEIKSCILLCRNCHQAHHCGDLIINEV